MEMAIDNKEVVCTGKNIGTDGLFEWTEEKIKCFGMYHTTKMKSSMCNCIDCFKRRYLDAITRVADRSLFDKDSCEYNSVVLTAMRY